MWETAISQVNFPTEDVARWRALGDRRHIPRQPERPPPPPPPPRRGSSSRRSCAGAGSLAGNVPGGGARVACRPFPPVLPPEDDGRDGEMRVQEPPEARVLEGAASAEESATAGRRRSLARRLRSSCNSLVSDPLGRRRRLKVLLDRCLLLPSATEGSNTFPRRGSKSSPVVVAAAAAATASSCLCGAELEPHHPGDVHKSTEAAPWRSSARERGGGGALQLSSFSSSVCRPSESAWEEEEEEERKEEDESSGFGSFSDSSLANTLPPRYRREERSFEIAHGFKKGFLKKLETFKNF